MSSEFAHLILHKIPLFLVSVSSHSKYLKWEEKRIVSSQRIDMDDVEVKTFTFTIISDLIPFVFRS